MILPRFKQIVIGFATAACLAMSTFAASPDDYVERVETARISVEMLLDDMRNKTQTEDIPETIASIKEEIPAAESIEWNGGGVQTNNEWLHHDLKRFSDAASQKERSAILIAISERLLAVAETAKELQKQAQGERSKDEDKQKLGEILGRPEYQKPEEKGESLFQKWWREFLEWLSKMFPDRPDIEPSSSSGLSTAQFVLQIVVFAAVGALVIFAIFKFLPLIRRRTSSGKDEKDGDRVILGERIDDDVSAFDLFGEAEQLAREGDLRSAIRKGYIAMLCDLADRKIVRLDRSKTNRDYLRDVRRIEPLFENVRGLTSSFEVNWYGLRPAEAGDWEEFRSGYQRTVAEARRVQK
jgi:Domain of unknown function (DUF4129)